jgi:methylmalonyl-CoA mutase N-terminal domain/subunit
MEGEQPIPPFRVNPLIEKTQIERLREFRASRDEQRVCSALQFLEKAARGTENLMPFIVDAAECSATVGEISDRLRNVFGEFR